MGFTRLSNELLHQARWQSATAT
ncbi:uncharacterized protein METZ01_LOCUS353402 [marine metagenome]|uniref:Uncharacterized protein n=1 Tax=marine metagenome TaxID=408172 RepID=A0A382RUD1_9ZZZZ